MANHTTTEFISLIEEATTTEEVISYYKDYVIQEKKSHDRLDCIDKQLKELSTEKREIQEESRGMFLGVIHIAGERLIKLELEKEDEQKEN